MNQQNKKILPYPVTIKIIASTQKLILKGVACRLAVINYFLEREKKENNKGLNSP